jgi:adenylylsulfate kinase-like enzyme
MLQKDGVVMMVMKVLVEMVMMMIPMKPSSMMVMMAMISPFREGISLADFCLPKSFLSLFVFCPTEAAESFYDPPLVLGFRGDDIREGVMAEVG